MADRVVFAKIRPARGYAFTELHPRDVFLTARYWVSRKPVSLARMDRSSLQQFLRALSYGPQLNAQVAACIIAMLDPSAPQLQLSLQEARTVASLLRVLGANPGNVEMFLEEHGIKNGRDMNMQAIRGAKDVR